MGAELPDYQSYFNSRPHGGRQARPIFFDASRDFNSRPHGGRLQPVADQIHLKNFNSRPHGGRREKSVNFPVWLISTHALTEGDEHGYQIADSNSIFQLTPSRRATSSSLSSGNSGIYFNSRPHGGRRHDGSSLEQVGSYFNSRPHGGRRHDGSSLEQVGSYFNSRPHGGRPRHSRRTSWIWHFNSRPHGGRPPSVPHFSIAWYISTHALTEGDTLTAWGLSVYLSISTHALTEGDRNRFGRKFRKRIFQLTPSRRATLLRCSLALLDIFQLTPSRRATDPSGRGSNMSKISTHALTDGDRYRSSSAAGSNISTHALTEGDFSVPGFLRT